MKNAYLWIVRVYENGDVYEYEYGTIEHAREHVNMEKCPCELYEYNGELHRLEA